MRTKYPSDSLSWFVEVRSHDVLIIAVLSITTSIYDAFQIFHEGPQLVFLTTLSRSAGLCLGTSAIEHDQSPPHSGQRTFNTFPADMNTRPPCAGGSEFRHCFCDTALTFPVSIPPRSRQKRKYSTRSVKVPEPFVVLADQRTPVYSAPWDLVSSRTFSLPRCHRSPCTLHAHEEASVPLFW